MANTPNQRPLLVTSSNNIIPFLRYCESNRLDWKSVALACKLPLEIMTAEHWLPTNQLMKFLFELERAFGQEFAIQVARNTTIALLSPQLESRLKSVDTIEQAIPIVIDEISSLTNHVIVWVERKDTLWWLCHHSGYRPQNPGFDQAEWFRTLALVRLCKRYFGERWQPKYATMAASSPTNRILPAHYANTKIRYGGDYGAIAIPLPADFSPLTGTSASLDWQKSICKLINTYACLPWFTIDWFAMHIGMTRRTLQRHLANNELVFKALKEQARYHKAQQLLTHTDLSVLEISWQVGFTDLSNFNRAFKTWTGVTAPQFRRQNPLN